MNDYYESPSDKLQPQREAYGLIEYYPIKSSNGYFRVTITFHLAPHLQVRIIPSGRTIPNPIRNYPGPLSFTQKREEEDDHTESPAKPTTEEALVCAK